MYPRPAGHGFRFFTTPDECRQLVSDFGLARELRLWAFPEAVAVGAVRAVPDLYEEERRLVWLGKMPSGLTAWSSFAAATSAGFVCIVRPILDETNRSLFLGEIYTRPPRSRPRDPCSRP